MTNIVQAKNIKKTFVNGEIMTPVLKDVNLEVRKGEFLSIMGRSGAGKSTLMYQLSLLDDPTDGEVIINGENVLNLSNEEKTLFRLKNMGYIFQDYALVPELTAIENAAIPLLMQGYSQKEAYAKVTKILHDLGLEKQINNLPSQLSGGEQQRISIARAIAHEPDIIFCDEPTANLDSDSARTVINILKDLNIKGQTIIMVTHEYEYGVETDRIVHLANGYIDREEIPDKNTDTTEII